MKHSLPDLEKFEARIFYRKNVLASLLYFCRVTMGACQAGLVYGTDHTLASFLPPGQWDRGVMHKLSGQGMSGFFFRLFVKPIVRIRNLSPIPLYRTDRLGALTENEGVIAWALRNHQDFYEKGIKVLIIDKVLPNQMAAGLSNASVTAYDGHVFTGFPGIKVNTDIVRQFRAQNFMAAYVPDYGAIVFNTVEPELLSMANGSFVRAADLKQRLDAIISAIETASLAYLGLARGKHAAQIIWRKERELRRTIEQLKQKEAQLADQKKYLRAVGGVTAEQLNMTALSISNGVYAFMDMVGSAFVRQCLRPRDYFLVLNLCHEIAAEAAGRFACRVDNFMGDAVVFQNVSVFDDPDQCAVPGLGERVMLMTCMLASVFNEIHRLKQGYHPMDREGRVVTLIKNHGVEIHFRAGLEYGTALVGPLGSRKRKIVTAIGEAVNTASRLESCGIKDGIHITETILKILDHALVSKDTPLIRNIVLERPHGQWVRQREYIPFFDFFQTLFSLGGCNTQNPGSYGLGTGVVQKRTQVSYKEFAQEVTYFIQCIPGPGDSPTCPGI